MTYSICKNKFIDKNSSELGVQNPNDYSELLEDIEQQTQPKHSSQYYFDRGMEHFNVTAYGKAIECFLSANEENIREDALSCIAFSHYMLGNTGTALSYANQVFAINPKNKMALDVIAKIESKDRYQSCKSTIIYALYHYKENKPKQYLNFKNTIIKKLKRFTLNVAQTLKINNGLSHKFENQSISKDDKINLLIKIFKKQIENKSYDINDKVEELFFHSIKRWFEANSDSFQSRKDVVVFFDVLIQYGSYLANGHLTKSPISDKERRQKLEIQFVKKNSNIIIKALVGADDIIRQEASLDGVEKISTSSKRMMIKNYNIKVYREYYSLKGNYKNGKNTIPRMFWQIMDKIKILPKGHFLEVKRENLVGQDREKTIEKTNAVLKIIEGGILFVNETNHYSDDIGKVAIDTIITHIKNNQNSFSLIVGGYYENSASMWINLWLPSQNENVNLQTMSMLELKLRWD